MLRMASLPARGEFKQEQSPQASGGGSERQAEGLAECVPTLRSPSVHVGADRAGDAERLCGDGDVLVVHGAVVIRGDVGV